MRIAVLGLAVLGCITSGFVAFVWFQILLDPELDGELRNSKNRIKIWELKPPTVPSDRDLLEKSKAKLKLVDGISMTSYCLLAALPLGLAGGVVGFMRRGLVAGILLLLTVPAPVFFSLQAPDVLIRVLVAVGPFVIAGGLAFFVKPPPEVVEEEAEPPRKRKAVVVEED
jgi:hypothetical protein